MPIHAIQRSFLNNGFEEVWGSRIPASDSKKWCWVGESTVPPWNSTDPTSPNNNCSSYGSLGSGNIIELWFHNGPINPPVIARDGVTLAELNANQPGTLGQSICILQGEEITWKLSHRGRTGNDNMQFFIGPSLTQVAAVVLDAITSKTGVPVSHSCPNTPGYVSNSTCSVSAYANGDSKWADYSGSFTWDGPSGDLLTNFKAIGSGTTGNFLDEVYFYLKPVVEFSALSGAEAESVVTPTAPVLKLVGQVDSPINIQITITGGTAKLGEDYTTPTGTDTFTVTIPVGNYDNTHTFETGIEVINDKIKEGDETIIMQVNTDPGNPYIVSSSGTCNTAGVTTATYTINDDDADLHLIKNTALATGEFNFTLTNVDTDLTTPANETTATITTVAIGTDTEFDADTDTDGTQAIKVANVGTDITISETIPPGWAVSGSCDVVGGSKPTTESIPINTDGTVTIPAANVTLGSSTTCTYNNTPNTSISGRVFEDSGLGTGGKANNGLQDGDEIGISGVTVELTDCGATIHSSATTDDNGDYTLVIPGLGDGTDVCVKETNLANYFSISGSGGDSGSTYDVDNDYTSFTLAADTSYTGLNFGDVIVNGFSPDHSAQGEAKAVLYYAHTFTAMSDGTVKFTIDSDVSTPDNPDWTTQLYKDSNCNGMFDGDEPELLIDIDIPRETDTNYCILVKQTIPDSDSVSNNYKNVVTIKAHFNYYIPSGPSRSSDLYVTDTTTVIDPLTRVVLNKAVNKTEAYPGDILLYTLTYTNNTGGDVTALKIQDAIPNYTTLDKWCCAELGAKTCSDTPGDWSTSTANCTVTCAYGTTLTACASGQGSGLRIQWEFTGTLSNNTEGDIKYSIKIDE
ncbi:hypothetical protein TI05_11700 [Achromatium sp. WMS3]|nr:hypothetical protein TI05_11700 [Achromatium sp. WMS3]